ncbi:MAG: hypothetical protein V3S55_06275 [Nitrospiraceae bacterium]
MKRIYVATSWRNQRHPEIVEYLLAEGHEVYDFRNPPDGLPGGFQWAQIDPDWQQWDAAAYRRRLLNSPLSAQGFMSDMRALNWCDTCVLVMPCGRSAHLELGYAAGRGKRTVILLENGEPELMYLIADSLVTGLGEMAASV